MNHAYKRIRELSIVSVHHEAQRALFEEQPTLPPLLTLSGQYSFFSLSDLLDLTPPYTALY